MTCYQLVFFYSFAGVIDDITFGIVVIRNNLCVQRLSCKVLLKYRINLSNIKFEYFVYFEFR